MKILTWNIHRATKTSAVWKIIADIQPDIALLQEVGGIPEYLTQNHEIRSRNAITLGGNLQKFSTAILIKGTIVGSINLKSNLDWVNREIEYFKGNIISCIARLNNQEIFHVMSVYSPAWPVARKRLEGIDTSTIQLKGNPEVWATEILWSGLKNTIKDRETWIVGGDFNSSETFDKEYQKEHNFKTGGLVSAGNKEIRERMYALGFKECLREYSGRLTPTYKHSSGGIVHQLDHLYVSSILHSRLSNCITGDQNIVFGGSLSDHLPIIGTFTSK